DGSVGERQRGFVAGVVDLRLLELVESRRIRESLECRVDGLLHGRLVQGVELVCHQCPFVRTCPQLRGRRFSSLASLSSPPAGPWSGPLGGWAASVTVVWGRS